jgi:hypothetical protein
LQRIWLSRFQNTCFSTNGTQNYLAVSNHFSVFFRRNTLFESTGKSNRVVYKLQFLQAKHSLTSAKKRDFARLLARL